MEGDEDNSEPSSPLNRPASPISSDYLSPISLACSQPSTASSPMVEPPPKKRAAWQIHPSRAARNLWRGPQNNGGPRTGSNADCINADDEQSTSTNYGASLSLLKTIDQEESQDSSSVQSSSSVSSSSASACGDESVFSDTGSESDDESINNESEVDSSSCSDSDPESCDNNQEATHHELYPGSNWTVDEAVYDVLKDYLKHNETQSRLASHLKTFRKYLPESNNMPKRITHLFKYLEKMDPSFTESSHFYCSNCRLYIEDTSITVCEACKEDLVLSAFYTFNLENQIRNLLENCGLAEELDKVIETRNLMPHQGPNFLCDITSGAEYRRLNVSGYSVTLMWYTDGVKVKEKSKRSLWPIQFTICELPPHLRSQYIGVCGVWYDQHKPAINTFLAPFVKSLQDVYQKGGFEWTHPKTNSKHKSLIWAPCCCADAPARADVLNLMGHNSKYACHSCERKTVVIPLTPEELVEKEAGKRVNRQRGFVGVDDHVKMRGHDRMRKQAKKAFSQGTAVKGVKGPTCVEKIPGVD